MTAKQYQYYWPPLNYLWAGKKLFHEAIAYYLEAMHYRNFLNHDDKRLMLLAIHGLSTLDAYPLARVLINISFSYLTADEILEYLDQGQRVQRELDLVIPF